MPASRRPQLPSGQAVSAVREDSLTDRLGMRIRSRLYEMCRTIELFAPDYRREVRQAGACTVVICSTGFSRGGRILVSFGRPAFARARKSIRNGTNSTEGFPQPGTAKRDPTPRDKLDAIDKLENGRWNLAVQNLY